MEPNADGTLTVFGNRLTTSEVDLLIHDLALARNRMAPQVPVDLLDATIEYVVQGNADITAGLTADAVMIAMRHRGLGWVIGSFSVKRAMQVGETLIKLARGEPPMVDANQERGRHRPH
jgi:hypothetical protein